MKLTRATLAFTMLTAQGPAGVVTTEDGELRVDFDKRILWVGARFVPLEAVRLCTPAKSEFVCADCEQEFGNAAGLAGHRTSKHKPLAKGTLSAP